MNIILSNITKHKVSSEGKAEIMSAVLLSLALLKMELDIRINKTILQVKNATDIRLRSFFTF